MDDAIPFSPDGPKLPAEFLDSLLAGDVVFLCGTGVSAQLPDFPCLVHRTYEGLGLSPKTAEQEGIDKGRFEEVLGSLDRRLVDPIQLRRVVAELLAVPENPNLDQHRTILRLSHSLDNRISVVTTNFDTLLERAATELRHGRGADTQSLAGQALPAPGGPSFYGIVHLHGRLADPALELDETPLVLTSTDYGDAYLRSGWASRFLFDLVRCKTIALVGYSASDAPFRYVLNVLEADRERFPDLSQVYAFDAYEHDEEEVARRWEILAVKPLPYCKINPENGRADHSPLWRDLAQLADLAERPKRWRRKRSRAILRQPAAPAADGVEQELKWLFRRADLWPVVIRTVTDRHWFAVFQEAGLWTEKEATWVIPAWIAKDPRSPDRFECALDWQRRLGRVFTEQLAWRLRSSSALDRDWERLWRLFSLADSPPRHDPRYTTLETRLASDLVLIADLQEAVELLKPCLRLDSPYREPADKKGAAAAAPRLRDLAWPRMVIPDYTAALSLARHLAKLEDHRPDILELATAALRSALAFEVDLDLIGDDYDVNDFELPSIELHDQNQHREGVSLLVRLMADILANATAVDPDRTVSLISSWSNLPGRTGLRLYLHALRNEPFDGDTAMQALLDMREDDFWTIRREIALLLRDRARDASPSLVAAVESRIRETAESYYGRYSRRAGEPDWRPHARDVAVWLRLTTLQEAGVLSNAGVAELRAIRARRDHLDRPVEDRDFFDSYAGPVQTSFGDPSPIEEAPPGQRLERARELTHSEHPEFWQGWSAFSNSNPSAALEELLREPPRPAYGPFWDQFLRAISFRDDDGTNEERRDLATRSLELLASADDATLSTMTAGLCDLLLARARQGLPDVLPWIERVWPLLSVGARGRLDLSTDPLSTAINSPAGRLTEALLFDLRKHTEDGRQTPSEPQRRMLTLIAADSSDAARLGRVILVRWASFLTAADRDFVANVLEPAVSAPETDAAALRSVLLTHHLSPPACRAFVDAVRCGALEVAHIRHREPVAANLLRPALADVRGADSTSWGLSAQEVADVLREGPPELRSAALQVLGHWINGDDTSVEETWKTAIAPLLARIWPREREHRDDSTTQGFVNLIVDAGDEFPSALAHVRHYLLPFRRGSVALHGLQNSEIAMRFPHDTLELLWIVCGPKSHGPPFSIAETIDKLVEADPDLEIDRRLQWLEQNTERFD